MLGPVELPEDAELLEAVELVEAGEGDTIDGVVVLEDVVAVEGAVGDELVAAVGFGLSLGTPLANGLRAIRASSTLAGTVELSGVAVWRPTEVVVDAVDAAGGTGTVGAPPADALLSSSIGTAMRPTTSSATTIQSLRSIRSLRSELILDLRSSCSSCSSEPTAGRSMR